MINEVRKDIYLGLLKDLFDNHPAATSEITVAYHYLEIMVNPTEDLVYNLLNLLCKQAGHIQGLDDALQTSRNQMHILESAIVKRNIVDYDATKNATKILMDVAGTLRATDVRTAMAAEIERIAARLRIVES